MTKILISPGYGAGWSSWAHGDTEQRKFWLSYEPIIEFIEGGGAFTGADTDIQYETDGNTPIYDALHPLLRQFIKDYVAKFGKDEDGSDPYFYFGGANDLAVTEVFGPFMVDDYDGSESVTTSSDFISLP